MGRYRIGRKPRKAACQVVALQYLGVVADVTIRPDVVCGEPEVTCSKPRIVDGKEALPDLKPVSDRDGSTIRVFQELCIRIPITYDAKVECEMKGVIPGPTVAAADKELDCCDDLSGSSDGECTSGSDSASDVTGSGTDCSSDE